jgi:hypothetical protein
MVVMEVEGRIVNAEQQYCLLLLFFFQFYGFSVLSLYSPLCSQCVYLYIGKEISLFFFGKKFVSLNLVYE